MTSRKPAHGAARANGQPKNNSESNATPVLAEGFVLLDNSTSSNAISLLFEHPSRIIRADQPEDVTAALPH